eukprot:TRINITY_DN62832_c0_g1_i2.p1 TRINITY_DN62832_c0_g1~~TRINITY_DN62832_c0_g1_i2.p1  ORF type:complete len:995 (+),score=85.60 TRINITY_DN62832_c0_g1_i2:41-2986(+)
MGGKGAEPPWSNLFEIMHHVEDPDSTCALCKFTADLKSTFDTNPCCGSWEEFLTGKEKSLAEQEKELQTKIEVQQHARCRVMRDLETIEGVMEGMKKEKQEIHMSRAFTQAAIRSITNETFATQIDTLTNTTTEEVEKLRSAVWLLKNEKLKEDELTKGMQQLEDYTITVQEQAWNSTVLPFWLDVISALATRLGKDLPTLQIAETRLLTLLARRAAHNTTNMAYPDSTVVDCFMQCNGLQKLTNLLKSINDDVKASTCICVSELCVTPSSKDAFALAGGVEALLHIMEASRNEVVLRYALRTLWNQAMNNTNKEVIRSKKGVATVLHLLTMESDEVVENACVALGYLTLDVANMEIVKECNGIATLLATLRHPNPTVLCHAAGALWHCAANDPDNRVLIREMGGISALIDLLRAEHHVADNAAGALWNCVVDEQNTKMVHALGGLQPLIQLLTGSNPMENACGALTKCCELHAGTRAAVRKLDGLKILIELLKTQTSNIVCYAATAIKNCARNDLCKSALVKMGGVADLVQLVSNPTNPDSVEDILGTLLICSIKDPAKEAIREAGGLPILLNSLFSSASIIKEKAMATLRNCSTLAENRNELLQLNCVPTLVSTLQGSNVTTELREYTAATLWNLAWDDRVKQSAMADGSLAALVNMLSLSYGDAVVENVAGAMHSLTIHVANRDHVRNLGGIHGLISLLGTSTNEFVLENTLGALKNCTMNNPENLVVLRELQAPEILVQLLGNTSESVVRECGWCLKNMANDDVNSELIGNLNGVQAFLQIAQDTSTSENTRKVAILALKTLSTNPHNRALMQTLSQQHPNPQQPPKPTTPTPKGASVTPTPQRTLPTSMSEQHQLANVSTTSNTTTPSSNTAAPSMGGTSGITQQMTSTQHQHNNQNQSHASSPSPPAPFDPSTSAKTRASPQDEALLHAPQPTNQFGAAGSISPNPQPLESTTTSRRQFTHATNVLLTSSQTMSG